MAKQCIGCGRVWLTWARVQQSIGAMNAAGMTPAEAKRCSPRCLRCTQQLLGRVSAAAMTTGDGDGFPAR